MFSSSFYFTTMGWHMFQAGATGICTCGVTFAVVSIHVRVNFFLSQRWGVTCLRLVLVSINVRVCFLFSSSFLFRYNGVAHVSGWCSWYLHMRVTFAVVFIHVRVYFFFRYDGVGHVSGWYFWYLHGTSKTLVCVADLLLLYLCRCQYVICHARAWHTAMPLLRLMQRSRSCSCAYGYVRTQSPTIADFVRELVGMLVRVFSACSSTVKGQRFIETFFCALQPAPVT